MSQPSDPTMRMVQSGLLAWILPGAGHYILGQRGMAAVFFAVITFCYGTGLLIGGVKTSIDPVGNRWLFLAEMCTGGYTVAGYMLARTLPTMSTYQASPYVSYYPESDVALIYLSVGGLLNLLAILDALARAQTGGLPVFHHEKRAAEEAAAARAGPESEPT